MNGTEVRVGQPVVAQPVRKKSSTTRDGGLLGLALSLVLQPFEVIRTQIVLHGDKRLGTIQQMSVVCSKLYKDQGLRFFWKGSLM